MLFLLACIFPNYAQTKVYVSPEGNDSSPGTEANPVQTLNQAKEIVRSLKSQTEEDISVLLRGGLYLLTETVVFGVEDGGKEGQIITWSAYPGEVPVLSSGLKISGWKKSGNLRGLPAVAKSRIYEAGFPAGLQVPRSLFDGDTMLRRARSKGFKSRIDAFGRDGQGHLRSFNVMYVNDRAELKKWDNVQDLELVIRPWCLWNMNNLPVESIDLKERSIKTRVNGTYFLSDERFNRFPDEHAWIENLIEGMTEPGSWCINTKLGKIYYWPADNQPGNEVVIPVLQEFIRVEGKNDMNGREDIPVKNLVFRGITFKHNDRYVFTNEDAGIQHDWELFDTNNAFFRFRGAEDCTVEECEFMAGGGVGIRLDLYCRNITVQNNYIHDIGGTGIFLGGYGLGTKDVNTKNIITNNKISNAARLYWHSCGITISQSSENLISHNQISGMPYTGMVITGYRPWFMHQSRKNFIDGLDSLKHYNWHGGPVTNTVGLWIRENSRSVRWDEIGEPLDGPGGSVSATFDSLGFFRVVASYLNMNHNRQNIIEYNEISDVMKVLGDGNGIYISDAGYYNVIRYNFIHTSPTAWGVGIRTDAFQMNTSVFGNIIWKFSGGIASSANNLAFNNIVASCRDMGLSEEPGKHLDFYFDYRSTTSKFTDGFVMRNVIWHDGNQPPSFRLNPAIKEKAGNVVDHNFYFWKGHQDEMEKLLSTFRELKIDPKGMATDPLFTDPENGDFNLNPASPLLRNGFVPLNQDKMGLTKNFPKRF